MKRYITTLGIGIIILLAVLTFTSHKDITLDNNYGNEITGLAIAQPSTTIYPLLTQPSSGTAGIGQQETIKYCTVLPCSEANANTLQVRDPANLYDPTKTYTKFAYNPQTHVLELDSNAYQITNGGTTWIKVSGTTREAYSGARGGNGFVQTTYNSEGTPSRTTLFTTSGTPLGTYSPSIVEQLRITPAAQTGTEKKYTVTYNGHEVTPTATGFNVVENGVVTSSMSQVGDVFITNSGGDVSVSRSANGNNPVPELFSMSGAVTTDGTRYVDDKFNTLFIETDPATGKTRVRQVSADGTKENIVQEDGVIVRALDKDGKTVKSQTKTYFDGSTGTFSVEGGRATYEQRFNDQGEITHVTLRDGTTVSVDIESRAMFSCGGCTVLTRTTATGKTEYYRVTGKDEKGEDIIDILTDADRITDAALGADQRSIAESIDSNRFWTGNSDLANYVKSTNQIYAGLSFANHWIDKWNDLKAWKSQVDGFFEKYVPTTKTLVSNICDEWTDKTNAPSNFALDESGGFAAHISGEKIDAAQEVNGVPQSTYIYKITFYVSKGILVNPENEFEFSIGVERGTSSFPVNMKQGVAGTDKLRIGGTIDSVGVSGNTMIVRFSSDNFDRVCLNFGSGFALKGSFKNYLKDGKLCNSFIESKTTYPGTDGEGYRSFLNTILGGSGDDEGDSPPGTSSGSSNPSVSNNPSAPSNGGL